jgi:YVTN family beta-propeller protein
VVNKGVAPSWDSQPNDPKPRGNHSSLMVMDLKTGAVQRKVPLHDQAHEIEIAPDRRTAVIPHFVWTVPGHGQQPGSQVTVIDLKTDAQLHIDIPAYTGAHGVKFIDDDRVVLTADAKMPETEKSFLLELNIRTGVIERAIPTKQDESHLVQLSPDKKSYFVTDLTGRFSAIDRETGKVKRSIRTGDGTEGFDVSPDGKEIWVAARNEGRVTILDASTLERKGSFRNEGGPIRLHFMPDGKHVLVTNRDENTIGIIDAKSRLELKEINLMVPRLMSGAPQVRTPSGAMMIAVVPSSNTAFVANSHAGVVTAIDTETWELKGFLKAGLGPDPLAYLPGS